MSPNAFRAVTSQTQPTKNENELVTKYRSDSSRLPAEAA